MEREIARFNERIMVQINFTEVDKYGNHTASWKDYYECFTYASTYQYDKERASAVTSEEQTINFEVRWCPELESLSSTKHRVVFRSNVYDIVSVDFMNYQRKNIRIVCKLEKKDAAKISASKKGGAS